MATTSYRLVYPYDLPSAANGMAWQVRATQRKRAIQAFGVLLPRLQATTYAFVTFTRVLGPRQRAFDSDNLRTALKGVRDALKYCGYIKDDSPTWAHFDYEEDDSRRDQGPIVHVDIRYEEGH